MNRIQQNYLNNLSPKGELELDGLKLAQVISQHRDSYTISCENAKYHSEITGNMRFSAESSTMLPAVGDWVGVTLLSPNSAIIVKLFPRMSLLTRQAVSKNTETQLMVANINIAFIVQSVGHDFNLNRLERYVVVCRSAKIEPKIIISKTDLATTAELESIIDSVKTRLPEIEIICISNLQESSHSQEQEKKLGIKPENESNIKSDFESLLNQSSALASLIHPGLTYCFLGSSGVGKSTMINLLLGRDEIKTKEISKTTNKGKHTSTTRELYYLPNGAALIDTPGMRELGMAQHEIGITQTYEQITELMKQCKFHDCDHEKTAGCAIVQALADGSLSREIYKNYQKLNREQTHYSQSEHEKRKKMKAQGKLYKSIINKKKQNR